MQKLHDKWNSFGLDSHSRYDGISSLPATVDRPAVFRIIARNIFSDTFKMVVVDIDEE